MATRSVASKNSLHRGFHARRSSTNYTTRWCWVDRRCIPENGVSQRSKFASPFWHPPKLAAISTCTIRSESACASASRRRIVGAGGDDGNDVVLGGSRRLVARLGRHE